MVKNESKLIKLTMLNHGIREVHPNSSEFNVMWSSGHIKPFALRTLHDFQRANHFPRSYELTRKDRLYENVARMQQTKGFRNFNIIPKSFLLPDEFNDFYSEWVREKSPWIVKPIASSQGRGIYLVTHPNQVPLDEPLILSRYIHNPLLLDGFKFDLRIYVAVTSYDPLRIYIYEVVGKVGGGGCCENIGCVNSTLMIQIN